MDRLSGLKNFMYGKSVSKQRIEAWWCHLRRQGMQWWICFFKDMQDMNTFDENNPIHTECLKYCFMHIIQAELHRIAEHWNLHEIRAQKHSNIPCGKPDMMYFVPEMFGGRDFGHQVNHEDVTLCLQMYSSHKRMYSEDIEELIHLLLPNHFQKPVGADDALALYMELLQLIEDNY